jgi:hypothetical protein
MAVRRIWGLPVKKFDGDMIDNCFYIKDLYAPEYYVKMSEIFDWIKEKAEATGLTVELKDNNIMFISGSCLSQEEDEYYNINR